jgi:RsiW-degrading membrane proteinase PrsW (M82 family)
MGCDSCSQEGTYSCCGQADAGTYANAGSVFGLALIPAILAAAAIVLVLRWQKIDLKPKEIIMVVGAAIIGAYIGGLLDGSI